jgi:hypothetical protein
MKIKIAIAYHKPSIIISDNHYIPIHVGNLKSNIILNITGDDGMENISYKNPYYCELTALYWIWKNITADYKGLCHYRRLFTVRKIPIYTKLKYSLKLCVIHILLIFSSKYRFCFIPQVKAKNENELKSISLEFSNKLELILKDGYDIIAPKKVKIYPLRVRDYFNIIGKIHIDILEYILKNDYPEFYIYYMKAMNKTNFYYGNISIMNNNIFNEYCTLLFSILEKHENIIKDKKWVNNFESEIGYSRVSGYLGEIITNAFIFKYSLNNKIKEVNIISFI